jgi:hypothetical protein
VIPSEQGIHDRRGPSPALPERSLGDLLNETFAIYGARFGRIIGLAALIQVPVGLLGLIPAPGMATFAVIGVVSLLAMVALYGVTISAIGQHYVIGEIGIGSAYSRVWWRVVSLLAVAVVLVPVLALGAASLVLVFPAIAVLCIAVPAVVVEGHRPRAALRRVLEIMRGSWLRVSGITLVVLLVMIGLGLLVQAPFAIASYVAAPEGSTALGTAFRFAGSLVARTVAPPVAAIAFTLLYYDLRVRREGYDVQALSREMGTAAA